MTQLKKYEMPQTDPHNTFSHRLSPYVLAAGDPGILQEVCRDSYHTLVTEPRAGTQARGQHAPASIFKMLYGRQTETVHAALRSAEDRGLERKFIFGPLYELLPSSPFFSSLPPHLCQDTNKDFAACPLPRNML